ncbi:DUF4145 domain-containing protein [Nonomuraea sp. NBC_01738]|uniref:DUF4145 domain-containing protein n=1 Tax=Nonomuraea sp. NBC_01738 TaxID=2976003 RepID=UPI002E1379AC|nr:DUF4145 domain-containing protein [Nonomuraea sp. NBC_01738]
MARWGAKFDVDCPGCGRASLAREPDAPHKVFLPAELRPYALALCQSCHQVLLLLSGEPGPDLDPDDLPARPAPVLWPAPGREIGEQVPAPVRRELIDARAGLRSGSPSAAILHVRRVLEAVCADHGVTGRTLFHALRELRHRGLIDGRLLSWAEELRELGNEAAHLRGAGPLGRQEAAGAVELAEALVDYLYVFSAKYRDFQVRRAKPARKEGRIAVETPAMRILRKSGTPFAVHPYPHNPAHTKSRTAIAETLGIPAPRMLKAVVLYLGHHAVLAIAPIGERVDEHALAAAFGARDARVAVRAEVVRIGEAMAADVLSPLALPYLPSVLDAGAARQDSVYVSSGRHGLELELTPGDLIRVTSARTAAIVK